MNNIWTKKWKTILLWFCGYSNFLAFALVGGYMVVKNEDEDLQKTTKNIFFVTLIFTAITALLSIFNYLCGFSDNYYSSSAYEFYSTCNSLVSIAKIIVYAVFIILKLVKKEDAPSESVPTIAQQENNPDEE